MAGAQHAAYIVIDGPGHEGTRLALREGITSFGRLPSNDVILLGDLVSRHHSRITFFEGRATLQDLGSHNGSWVNGERTTSRVLTDGDQVRVGNFRIVFRQGPIPAPLDETTAGEETGAASSTPEPDGAEGVEGLLREVESARRGSPSPTRAFHFLYRVTEALARAADAARYADLLLELAIEHVPADAAAWLTVEGRELTIEVARGPEGPLERLEVFVPAVEWSLDKRIPVRSENPSEDPRFPGARRRGSVLAVPLLRGAPPGALYFHLEEGRERGFQPEHLHRIGALGHLMEEGLETLAARGPAGGGPGPEAALPSPLLARLPRTGGDRPAIAGPAVGSLLLVDLHGLAPTADKHDPDRVLDLVIALQRQARHRAEEAGGWAVGLNGHRALLAFEAAGGGRSPAARAVEAAVALRADVDARLQRGSELAARRLRAGIATGPLLVGAFGGESPGAAALGPPAGTARRLLEAAGAGRILVDQPTREGAGSDFESRRIGSQPARAGAPAQAVFEIVGRARTGR